MFVETVHELCGCAKGQGRMWREMRNYMYTPVHVNMVDVTSHGAGRKIEKRMLLEYDMCVLHTTSAIKQMAVICQICTGMSETTYHICLYIPVHFTDIYHNVNFH